MGAVTMIVPSEWVQLTSVGMFWISFHCVGMCGPIYLGLDVAQRRCGGCGAGGKILQVMRYQGGRALVYLFLGIAAGLLGERFGSVLTRGTAPVTLFFGLLLVAMPLWRFYDSHSKKRRGSKLIALSQLTKRKSGFERGFEHLSRTFISPQGSHTIMLGMFLALMPCMITLWALSLAVSVASAFWGAIIMLTLVLYTTPVFLTVSFIPRIGRLLKSSWGRFVPAISGFWMCLCAAASLGWVPHQHLSFVVAGRDYVVMFW